MSLSIRSWLYCPATRTDLIAKALRSSADAVVIDLEDAVPSESKNIARDNAVHILAQPRPKPVWVRMNTLDSPWGLDDARALSVVGPDGVRVPKCRNVDEVRRVGDLVDCPLGLLIESAEGVEQAIRLAAAHQHVTYLALGEADLMADLRVRNPEALDWARMRIVVAARATGIASPVQSVHTKLSDLEGLRRTTVIGRDNGFFGRSVIHPSQLAIVNNVYTPSSAEVAEARRIVTLMEDAAAAGRATNVDKSGQFIDPAMVEQARWVIELQDTQPDNVET
jgi:citrate lyase subunit beta/citryl-CoA lyase